MRLAAGLAVILLGVLRAKAFSPPDPPGNLDLVCSIIPDLKTNVKELTDRGYRHPDAVQKFEDLKQSLYAFAFSHGTRNTVIADHIEETLWASEIYMFHVGGSRREMAEKLQLAVRRLAARYGCERWPNPLIDELLEERRKKELQNE